MKPGQAVPGPAPASPPRAGTPTTMESPPVAGRAPPGACLPQRRAGLPSYIPSCPVLSTQHPVPPPRPARFRSAIARVEDEEEDWVDNSPGALTHECLSVIRCVVGLGERGRLSGSL